MLMVVGKGVLILEHHFGIRYHGKRVGGGAGVGFTWDIGVVVFIL